MRTRTTLYLAVVLIVAVAVLFFIRRQPAAPDYSLGGRLFTPASAQIEGLLVTRAGAQYRLDRSPSGVWTLSGAISDFIDQNSMALLLENLTKATGGRLLPGSDPEDRRYDFNGPGSLRLTIFSDDGRTEKLAIGAKNPVTGAYYGSGAGRPACFPVSPGFREILAAVPGNLQLKILLPKIEREALTRVEVWRGGQQDVLQRWNQRWWLRMPEQGEIVLGPWYRDYNAHYQDRKTPHDGRTWLLADDQAVRLLIFESSQIVVKEILPPGDAARMRQSMELDGLWRRVVLNGQGINPDPTDGSPDQLEISFGLPADETRVPALRRGTVLLTEPEAVITVSEPRSHLLDARAVGFLVGVADSLVLEREGRLLMKAHRDTNPAGPDERRKVRPVDFWLTDFPTEQATGLDSRSHHGRSQNFLINLERTAIFRVLPPTPDRSVLKDKERLRLELWFGEGQRKPGVGSGVVVLEVGFIDEARLPQGSPALAHSEDGLAPVGLYRPDTGQLLQIPSHAITTARAWAR